MGTLEVRAGADARFALLVQAVKACVRFLEDLTAKVDDIKLDPSPQRFGNKAFRDWLATMEDVRRLPTRSQQRPS